MSMYNLTDILRFRFKRGLDYKGSLAEKYLVQLDRSKTPKYHVDFGLLKEIIDSYDTRKETNCICIHMRLGDIIKNEKYKRIESLWCINYSNDWICYAARNIINCSDINCVSIIYSSTF